MKLSYDFYCQHGVVVARNLLGKKLVFKQHQGIITETEAYRGADDPASHAYRKMTPRNQIMFGAPGHAYIYLSYGMHHCFNIVTEAEGQASAVLIRGLLVGKLHLNGPGKICRYLGITRQEYGVNLIESNDFYLMDEWLTCADVQITGRIGIRQGKEKPWRFVWVNFQEHSAGISQRYDLKK